MLKLIALIAFAIAATSATAESMSCDLVAQHAQITMNSRQNGLTAPEQMKINNKHWSTIEDRNRGTKLIVMAYELPLMKVTANKQRMIDEFESEIFVACLKGRI